jgi:MGT family glycosyltransferase
MLLGVEAGSPPRHVLVLPYPSWGHVLPTLGLARELLRRGHRVTYGLDGGPLADRAAATGAAVVGTGSGLLSDVRPPDSWTDDAAGAALVRYVQELVAATRRLGAALDGDRPDVVLYDSTVWAPGRVLGRVWERPTLQVLPVFATNEHWSLMDVQVAEADHPDLAPDHPGVVAARRVVEGFLADWGVDPAELDALVAGADEHSLVLLPRALQPAGDTFDERHAFVGPCHERTARTWTPPGDPALPLVLVSLGTVVGDRPEFFARCVAELAGLPVRAVLVAGDVPVEVPGPVRDRIAVTRWLDYDAALPHAAVFVSQAGMGSVLAAAEHGVPLVVVPHQPEQRVNAARVVELGLGRALDPAALGPGALAAAVEAVRTDPAPAAAARVLGAGIAAAGGPPRAADVVERRAARQPAGAR